MKAIIKKFNEVVKSSKARAQYNAIKGMKTR